MIIGARNNKRLVGKTNKLPNPLVGDGIIEDNGTKVRMEEEKQALLFHIFYLNLQIYLKMENLLL